MKAETSDSEISEALEAYKEDSEAVREMHAAMLKDLQFSNPADPRQWSDEAVVDRKGRPTETFDNTNQHVMQVVNDARQNKSGIEVLPVDSDADPAVADKLNGVIRHIEYTSRADLAYDTALEHAARIGQGWIRVLPRIVRPETNEQEITISRIHDPFSVKLDCNSTQPDGSDAVRGWVDIVMSERAFKRKYPKAEIADWRSDDSGWFLEKQVRLCEYFQVDEEEENHLVTDGPDGDMTLSERDYWDAKEKTGIQAKVKRAFKKKTRTVTWKLLSGLEVIEKSTYPSQWIGLVPVIGHELWIEGKRHLCGMVRGLRAGQIFHNVQMNALIEAQANQPKAPFLASERAIRGLDTHWQSLASGNPSYVVYNDLDDDGPINMPQRQNPPQFPVSFASGAKIGQEEMQAGVGQYRSNFGAPSNAVSGRAKIQDQKEGDTANFHYPDNLRRAKEHVGRIIVGMIGYVYDTRRQALILGQDGKQSSVTINPNMKGAVKMQGRKVIEINPNVGKYDVRVKTGPAYTTQRQELAQNLKEFSSGNPVLQAAFAPLFLKMNDLPDADKVAKIAMATLPPEIQKAYDDEENEDGMPPQVTAQMQQMQAQMQQMQQVVQQAQQLIQQQDAQLKEKASAAQAAQVANQIDVAKYQADHELKIGDQQLKAEELKLKQSELRIKQYEAQVRANAPAQVDGERGRTVDPALQPAPEETPSLFDQMNALMAFAQRQSEDNEAIKDAIELLNDAVKTLTVETIAPVEFTRDVNGMVSRVKKGSRVFDVIRNEAGAIEGAV